MPTEYFRVSNSKLKTYRGCQKAYEFKYVDKLTPIYKSMALVRGELVHTMIEDHLVGIDVKKSFEDRLSQKLREAAISILPSISSKEDVENVMSGSKELTEDEKAEVSANIASFLQSEEFEEVKLALPIMEGYFDYYKDDKYKPYYFKDQCSEIHVEMPIKSNVILEGYIDMLVTDQYGEIWIMDHKTKSKMATGIIKPNLQQGVLYYALAKYLGIPVKGVIWNNILWNLPTKPELLKSGELSRRKNINSTWKVYSEAIKEYGLDEDDYSDMKAILDGNEARFYNRSSDVYPQAMVDQVMKDLRKSVDEMMYFETRKNGIRNLSFNCGSCNFRDICYEQLCGHDLKEIIQDRYLQKQPVDI